MPNRLLHISVKNYRALADVSVDVGPINILFGPNGAGKSSFLDSIWFIRDCAIRSVETASGFRSHGIGILYDGAPEGDPISVVLATQDVEYQLTFGLSSGRIEAFAGERVYSKSRNVAVIERSVGSDKVSFFHENLGQHVLTLLREPQKLSLSRYLDFNDRDWEVDQLDRTLRFVHFHHCRSFYFYQIKQKGSEQSHETWLWERGENLWSILRNLHDKGEQDGRFAVIMDFMKEAFPSFEGIVLEQTGPTTVYASFLEKNRRRPIRASGVSDGHLQLLLLLTALFSEGKDRESIIVFDEPEVSLHPWALAVLARAIRLASAEWNKQCFIATHHPVLMSQFSPDEILEAEASDGQTKLTRLSTRSEVKDLLDQYPVGSLYMAEVVGGQRDDAIDMSEPVPNKLDATTSETK